MSRQPADGDPPLGFVFRAPPLADEHTGGLSGPETADVYQLVVPGFVWSALITWLARQQWVAARMPDVEGELPTYIAQPGPELLAVPDGTGCDGGVPVRLQVGESAQYEVGVAATSAEVPDLLRRVADELTGWGESPNQPGAPDPASAPV
jgi:hypothetical protein